VSATPMVCWYLRSGGLGPGSGVVGQIGGFGVCLHTGHQKTRENHAVTARPPVMRARLRARRFQGMIRARPPIARHMKRLQ